MFHIYLASWAVDERTTSKKRQLQPGLQQKHKGREERERSRKTRTCSPLVITIHLSKAKTKNVLKI